MASFEDGFGPSQSNETDRPSNNISQERYLPNV